MSKKIIAIALFVTMLLSLVTVANAVPEQINRIDAWAVNKKGQDPWSEVKISSATYKSSPATYTWAGTDNSLVSFNAYSKKITITGAYGDIVKSAQNFYTAEPRLFDINVTFWVNDPLKAPVSTPSDFATAALGNFSSDNNFWIDGVQKELESYTINGKIATPTDLPLGSVGNTITAEFEAKQGGNTQTYKIEYRLPQGGYGRFDLIVEYVDSGTGSKPVRDIGVDVIKAPNTVGNYNAYVLGNTLFIDYDNTIKAQGEYYDYIKFKAYANGNRVPPAGQIGYLVDDGTSWSNTSDPNNTIAGDPDPIGDTNVLEYNELGGSASNWPNTLTGLTGVDSSRWFSSMYTIAGAARWNWTSYKWTADGITGVSQPDKPKFFKVYANELLPDNKTPASTTIKFKNDDEYKIKFHYDTRRTTYSLAFEDANYHYKTGDLRIQWRAVPRALIGAVNIAERDVVLAVGEEKTMNITIAHATSFANSNLKLVPVNTASPVVAIDGMKVQGVQVGEVMVNVVEDVRGSVVDSFRVRVVASKTEDPVTVTPAYTQYRVIASGNLNVRSGPATSYPIVTKVTQANLLNVVKIENGWAELAGNAGYVSAQYIVPVNATGTVGNFVVTASSLNVRATAGGSKVGSLKSGTVVSVVGYEGAWAKLSDGRFVSSAYLRAV